MKLYRNNRNGTFTDVTKSAGLDEEMYGMGVAVGEGIVAAEMTRDRIADVRRQLPALEHRLVF